MKKNLILTDTKIMTGDEWLAFRKNGIGASEVGAVMGLNPWKSSIELFYEKIGEGLPYTIENMAMFMGKETEPLIAKLWQYWGGDQESMIANYRAGNIVRKCQRVNAYVNNPKYPWLFVSLDRKINKTSDRDEGSLEIKTISGYEAEKWEEGVPPSHVVQLQTQLLVCEFLWGELATLKDGRHFDCIPFEQHDNIQAGIVEHTFDFWQRVQKAREIMTQRFEANREFNIRQVEELTGRLQELEPPPDNSEAYSKFLKEKFNIAEAGERLGTPIELNHAISHKQIKAQIKKLEEDARLHENTLKNALREDFDKLDFRGDGYVSWKADTNGVRRFLNKVKNA